MNVASLPRVGSISDRDSSSHTDVSDVVSDLARLSNPMNVPRMLSVESAPRPLDPTEAWMCSIVRLGMCIQGILDVSPLDEDETLRILARLVGLRVVTLAPLAEARN